MPRYDLDEHDDDLDVSYLRRDGDRPYSGLGMVALGAAVLALFLVAGAAGVGFVMDDGDQMPADDDVVFGAIGLAFFVGGCTGLVGLSLGLAGSMRSDRNPL